MIPAGYGRLFAGQPQSPLLLRPRPCHDLHFFVLQQKPSDWQDDEPQYIPDPKAEKPDDWDDEEDGEWEPPQIGNVEFVFLSNTIF